MPNYVVDASVVMNYLITDTFTAQAQAFFNSITAADTLIVPEFCLLECTNVIWKQVRFHGMPLHQANLLVDDLGLLPLKRTPMKRLLKPALAVGVAHQLAVYDSAYIALAQRSGFPLVTVDEPQRKAALAAGVQIKPVTDFLP